MNALVSASVRCALTPDGQLWTSSQSLGHRFWTRYLDVYDEVRLLVRSVPRATPPDGWTQATGPGVVAAPVPDFHSPLELARHYPALRAAVRRTLTGAPAVHLRLACPLGETVWRLAGRGRPYGVELVGDPYDVFAPGSVEHPLRRVLRWWFPRQLRRQCAGACAATYVTQNALQRRYPPAPDAFSTHFSSIHLEDEAFSHDPRPPMPGDGPLTVITVGTLEQLYKAPDVLIDAVAANVRQGLDLRLVLLGDGRHRSELQERAARLDLAERVLFAGAVPAGTAVRDWLDHADLFVLASHQEGLPRAMIEAMARGLPCLGSTVGGIPELLPEDDLVAPGDAAGLAMKIAAVCRDRERRGRMGARNLVKAQEYREPLLRARRIAFYSHVRQQTQAWLQGKSKGG